MEWYKDINRELKSKYGRTVENFALYRVIQNLNLSEKRKIEKEKLLAGGTIVKYYEVVETLKYNYIPKGRWVLEQLLINNSEELTSNLTYEPFWVFQENQSPNLKACIFLIESSRIGPEAILSEKEKDDKEIEEMYEYLGGDAGIAEALKYDGGVSYSGLDAPSLIKED